MPSLLEHLESGDDAEPTVGAPPSELLGSVKAEGRRRRANRHRRNVGLAVLAVAMLAIPATVVRNGDHPDRDLTVAVGGDVPVDGLTADVAEPTALEPVTTLAPSDPPPPALTEVPPTVPPLQLPPTSVAPPVTSPPQTAPPNPASTAPPIYRCRNSQDPACGPFRWDPAPAANQPLVASFTKAPTTAAPGETVVFEVMWSDPDAVLTSDRISTDGTRVGTACALIPRYGPWTPPAANAGGGTIPYATTFATPGSYPVVVELGTADCTSPYGSETSVQTTITIKT